MGSGFVNRVVSFGGFVSVYFFLSVYTYIHGYVFIPGLYRIDTYGGLLSAGAMPLQAFVWRMMPLGMR